MSIRTKLFLAFATQIVLLILVGVVVFNQFATTQRQVETIEQHAIPALGTLNDTSTLISQYRVLQAMHLSSSETSIQDIVEQQMAENERKATAAIAAYQVYTEDPREATAIERLRSRWPVVITQNHRTFLPASQVGKYSLALSAYRQSQPLYDVSINSITTLIRVNQEQSVHSATIAREAITIAKWAVIAALAVGFVIAMVAGWFLTQAITRNLYIVMDAAAAVAHGDLQKQVVIQGRDELSHLATSFNTMVVALREAEDERLSYQSKLEQQVAERTHELQYTLQDLRASVEVRDSLSAMVQALSCPVIPVQHDILIMPLIGSIDTTRAELIIKSLLEAVEQHRARAVILDVTGVPIVDTQVAQVLLQVTAMLKLLGSKAVLVGLRPELAQTIVSLGVDLSAINTQADLEAGLRYVLRTVNHRI